MIAPLDTLTRFYSPEFTGETYSDFEFRSLTIDGNSAFWNLGGKRKVLGVLSPTLTGSLSFDVNLVFEEFGSLLEGILIIDGRGSPAHLTLSPNVASTGNLGVSPKEITVLKFYRYRDENEIHWTSTYTPTSIVESKDYQLILDIRPGGYDGADLGNLATFSHCFDIIKEQARFIKGNRLLDSSPENVLIRVHGNLNQTIHAKNLPPVGIKIEGISNEAGEKPVIDSEGVLSQFNRCVLIDNCHGLKLENLALKNLDSVSAKKRGCLVVTHSSRIVAKDIDFIGTGTLITLLGAQLSLGGSFSFTEPEITQIASVQVFSRLRASSVLGVSDESKFNENVGLVFSFAGASLARFSQIKGHSLVEISDKLNVQGEVQVDSISIIDEFCKLESAYFS